MVNVYIEPFLKKKFQFILYLQCNESKPISICLTLSELFMLIKIFSGDTKYHITSLNIG